MRKSKEKLLTIIGEGTRIVGDISAKESLRLDGSVRGAVSTEGNLHVGPKGQVTGNLMVGNVYISGDIQGDIEAKGKVSILSGGRVNGDVKSYALTVDDNAYFQGKCTMDVKDAIFEKSGAKHESYLGNREKPAAESAQRRKDQTDF